MTPSDWPGIEQRTSAEFRVRLGEQLGTDVERNAGRRDVLPRDDVPAARGEAMGAGIWRWRAGLPDEAGLGEALARGVAQVEDAVARGKIPREAISAEFEAHKT